MSNYATSQEMFAAVYQHYDQKEYAQADAIMAQEGRRFPAAARRVCFWRICLNSLLNQPENALDILRAALDDGLWFSEKMLREDDDIALLQGNPGFEALAKVSLERAAAAQANVKSYMRIYYPPSESMAKEPHALMFALHGNHSNADDSVRYWEVASSLGWLLGLPQSTQLEGPNEYTWNDREQSIKDVAYHYNTFQERYVIDPERITIGGFSMGGNLAAWLAISSELSFTGLVAIAPYIPDPASWEPKIKTAAKRGLRAFLAVGDQDVGCYEGTLELRDLFDKHGVPCQLRVFPGMGHVYPPDFGVVLKHGLNFIKDEQNEGLLD